MEQLSLSWEPERRLYTVSQLTAAIRDLLGTEFDDIWVAGEVSGVRLASSGHYYFTLKDGEAQLRCACFRSAARFLKFKPQDGMAVLARGRIDVYEARGEYQLLVEHLEPQGYGALQLAFEQLKKKLAEEGLFDAARKRALPKYPRRIGIVTSPTGAVIRDIVQILERRFPGLHIRLYPALVQGEGSVEAVCEGLRYFCASGWPDVVILARGGGSLEDLWTFNEEKVARAVAACAVPVISAIGHETDFTIADFVADLRAPTPSAAAEMVICTRQELLERIDAGAAKLHQAMRYRVAAAARRLEERGVDRATLIIQRRINRALQRVDELDQRLRERTRALLEASRRRLLEPQRRLRDRDPRLRLAQAHRRLDAARSRVETLIGERLLRCRAALGELSAHLRQLSPLAILERGYAIVQNQAGALVKSPSQAPPGAPIAVRLAQGCLKALVTETTPEG